uniref:thermonuclease family protein n=1 Tax=Pedobacter sp. ASV28 TaxID=2795123 RepID=UPI0018EBCD01
VIIWFPVKVLLVPRFAFSLKPVATACVVVNIKKQVVNQEMVKQGMAWHFKRYSTNETYARLELIARKNKVGLWQDKNPIAPWLWRKHRY